jgi:hypothetical protein
MAVESNRYAASSWAARAQNIHARQKEDAARTKRSRDSVESRKQIRARLKKSFVPFDAAEYVRLFGLFIGRMLCPHKRRLSYHWALSSTCDPSGYLQHSHVQKQVWRIMCEWQCSRSYQLILVCRFDELVQFMHFLDNADPHARTDRVWKIRPIVEALQISFKKGYRAGPFISFDEGMLPSHSKFNGTRMYMKDKPHKWGTKLFLTCCSKTAYCLR